MAQQLTSTIENFSLSASWGAGSKPRAVVVTKEFSYNLPAGSKITSAVIEFKAGIPKYGRTFRVNNTSANVGAINTIDVLSSAKATGCFVEFYFLSSYNVGEAGAASIKIENVNLIIEYTIPATDFTLSKSEVVAGEMVTATIDSEDVSITRRYTLSLGDTVHTYDANNSSGSTVLTVQEDFLNEIPNSKSGAQKITLDTLDADGTILHTTSKVVTLVCGEDHCPSIQAVTYIEFDTLKDMLYQGISSVKILATGIEAKYKATITSVRISGGGYDVSAPQTGSSYSYTTGVLRDAGINTFTVTVVDSRGNSTSKEIQFNVEAYTGPNISLFEVGRCNNDATLSANGESQYAKVTLSYSPYSEDVSVTSVILKYRENSSSAEWTQISYDGYLPTSGESFIVAARSISSEGYLVNTPVEFSTQQSFVFRIEIKDRLGQTTISETTLGTGSVFMRWEPSSNVISFGCFPTADTKNAFKIAGNWTLMHGEESIYEAILNKIYPVGCIKQQLEGADPFYDLSFGTWEQLGVSFTIGGSSCSLWQRVS